MKKFVFLNGKFIKIKDAKVSALDPGFLYAQGAFETLRSYNGKVFALERHLKRLKNSLPTLNIKSQYSLKELTKATNDILRLNNLKNAYIRLTVWQGEDKVNTLIFAQNYNGYCKNFYTKGFKGLIMNYPLNEKSALAGIKSLNYLFFRLAKQEAEKRGFDEAIFLNTKGFLAEGSRSNIFLVKQDRIFTPSLKCGCLPGITREVVIEIASKIKIPVREREIRLKELLEADEAFLTSSLMEVMPLTKLDNSLINKGNIGRITGLLQQEYRLAV